MENKLLIKYVDVDIYQQELLVLKDVQLEIQSGEFVYLLGKVGSGKSTLLKSIYHEIPILFGEAEALGYDLRKLKTKEIPFLRRKIGIVFQDFQLLTDRSINDNLLFVMKATGWAEKSKMEVRLHEVLKMVGLSTKGHKMPHQLSGGEQQRICIARALINSPKLILADEPTGNLDPESSAGIMQLLLEISRAGSAVIMATHNYNLIKLYPGRILKCVNGHVIEVLPTETDIIISSIKPGFHSDDIVEGEGEGI